MTAGLISLSGAWGGQTSGPNKYNRKGMFENATIRNVLVKPYLVSMGLDPLGQNPLPDTKRLKPWPALSMHVEETFRVQGYQGGPLYYKGAKLCLIWPRWAEAFPQAKWIIVRRRDQDIVNSCMKTGFMRKRVTTSQWQEWIDHHKQCFQEMHDAGLQIREVWPTKFVEGDFSEIKEAIEWLGLEFNEEKAKEFISPSLYTRS